MCSTDFALLNHRYTRSPFPAGECKGFIPNFLEFQRIPFQLNLFIADWNIFYLKNYALSMEFEQNHFNKKSSNLLYKIIHLSVIRCNH